MKNTLLLLIILVPTLMLAQGIKKEKVKSTYLSYPKIDVTSLNVANLKVDFCAGDIKVLSKVMKKTSTACKPKGGSIKDAKALEVFYYQVGIIEPVSYLKITDPSGKVAWVEKTTTGNKGTLDFGKKKCYFMESILVSAYKKDYPAFQAKSKKKLDKMALGTAEKFLNSALFFSYVPQSLEVYYIKSKDHDYSDLAKAATLAKEGYELIKNNAQNKGAQGKLAEASAIWEKALAESTPTDKKSRINKKVTLIISENLASANLFLLKYDKGLEVVGNALKLERNVTNNGTVRRKALLAKLMDLRKGYEINKNTPINSNKTKVAIQVSKSSEVASFSEAYKKFGNESSASEAASQKEAYKKAVASGDVNPYQRFVQPVAGGNMITLPDLASKIAGDPAGNKLEEFPEELTELEISTLILRGNNIKSIPSSIGKMTGLKKLVLANNKLTTLPDEIGQLTKLKNLNIKGNNISASELTRIQALIPNCKIKL